jgi:hypothetical protein
MFKSDVTVPGAGPFPAAFSNQPAEVTDAELIDAT